MNLTPFRLFCKGSLYIYLYIVIHKQDSFVVSQLFSTARRARCLRLGSKPVWLYFRRISYCRAIVILCVNKRIFYLYTFGIRVAIFFLVEWYKILLLRNKASLYLYSVNFLLFICDLVTSDWLIYCLYFNHLWLANLLMGKSINICWQFVNGRH